MVEQSHGIQFLKKTALGGVGVGQVIWVIYHFNVR